MAFDTGPIPTEKQVPCQTLEARLILLPSARHLEEGEWGGIGCENTRVSQLGSQSVSQSVNQSLSQSLSQSGSHCRTFEIYLNANPPLKPTRQHSDEGGRDGPPALAGPGAACGPPTPRRPRSRPGPARTPPRCRRRTTCAGGRPVGRRPSAGAAGCRARRLGGPARDTGTRGHGARAWGRGQDGGGRWITAERGGWGGGGAVEAAVLPDTSLAHGYPPKQLWLPPCVTFRPVAAPLRGPGRSPGLPFACCVGSLRSVGRCGRCSCWCRFRVRGAQSLVCRGCAECGGMCRLRVSGAQ